MEPNKVSIILTTFNGSKYISKQLDSILSQEVLADEIIICDDCSTDDTVEILRRYVNSKSIKLFINDNQFGVVANFKKAAKLATPGNWLVFADQDDMWLPQKLKRLIQEMQLFDDGVTPSLIYSDLTLINKNDAITHASFWGKQKIHPEKINLARLLYGNIVTGCTAMVNYPMAEEFFCMDNFNFLHDEWLALIAYTFGKAKFLNERLVLYRQHEANITFSENYKQPGILPNTTEVYSYITDKKHFLMHQFELAREFLSVYRQKLTASQVAIFNNFIEHESKNHLLKRLYRKLTYLQNFGS